MTLKKLGFKRLFCARRKPVGEKLSIFFDKEEVLSSNLNEPTPFNEKFNLEKKE
jgi:hypothetical protein